jgi:hypothetical protein
MPFDELYQQDTNAALNAMSLRPADPEPVRSGWGAPWRALKAAGAETFASTLDMLKNSAAAAATTYEADPVARVALGDEAIERGAAEGRRQIATGEAMNSVTGGAARKYAETLRPDPVTAGRAEQVVFSVVRPVSKLIAGGVVAGPFGVVGAAGEEGLTTSDELRRKGVDLPTRTAIGGLTAAATAATAFVPLAGSTLKATAGLYLAAGPGSYIAQQAATRAILENANYTDLAKQYDPLDPTGLLVASLVPLPFAAHGVHTNVSVSSAADAIAHDLAAGRAPDGSQAGVTTDTIDAALTYNLSIQADQQAAIHPVEAGEEIAAEIARTQKQPARSPAEAPTPAAPNTDGAAGAPTFDQNRLTGTEAAPGAPKPDAVQQAVMGRVAQLEAAAGDMPVKIGEDGQMATVSDEIARIRKEVDEGTDTELGHQDADLLRVAAECALTLS